MNENEFRQVVTSALMEQININSTVQGSLDDLTEASKCLSRGMGMTAKSLKNIMDILEKQKSRSLKLTLQSKKEVNGNEKPYL